MQIIKTTNEHGVSFYETKHLDIPEYCALGDFPQYGDDSLRVTLDGSFGLADLKTLVAYMEAIRADH
jgi:hypothetical protein